MMSSKCLEPSGGVERLAVEWLRARLLKQEAGMLCAEVRGAVTCPSGAQKRDHPRLPYAVAS